MNSAVGKQVKEDNKLWRVKLPPREDMLHVTCWGTEKSSMYSAPSLVMKYLQNTQLSGCRPIKYLAAPEFPEHNLTWDIPLYACDVRLLEYTVGDTCESFIECHNYLFDTDGLRPGSLADSFREGKLWMRRPEEPENVRCPYVFVGVHGGEMVESDCGINLLAQMLGIPHFYVNSKQPHVQPIATLLAGYPGRYLKVDHLRILE
eukprot:PhF_6_TR44253/c1_g1_i8/m.68101